MRLVVFGTTGSGKSTFASALAQARNVPMIELDLINWRPNWFGRNEHDEAGFVADVERETRAPEWVATGSYGCVRELMWQRATDVVFLDLPRHVIMSQVIRRSIQRAASQADVFPGCKENWGRLLDREHPIRWAWDTMARRRATFAAMSSEAKYAHITFYHCRSRNRVKAALAKLSVQSTFQ